MIDKDKICAKCGSELIHIRWSKDDKKLLVRCMKCRNQWKVEPGKP